MLVHSVRFYLVPSLPPERRAALLACLESLRAIPEVRGLFIGTPADVPPRPVIDTTYDVALTVLFDDVAGHNRYQVHPAHLKFGAEHRDCWIRVAVVDAA